MENTTPEHQLSTKMQQIDLRITTEYYCTFIIHSALVAAFSTVAAHAGRRCQAQPPDRSGARAPRASFVPPHAQRQRTDPCHHQSLQSHPSDRSAQAGGSGLVSGGGTSSGSCDLPLVVACKWCCVASDTAPFSSSSHCHRRWHAAICFESGTRAPGSARSAAVSESVSSEDPVWEESSSSPVPFSVLQNAPTAPPKPYASSRAIG